MSSDESVSDGKQLLVPMDDYNRRLVDQVHPPDWKNPVPDGRYNLVVVGGGTAGLVSAAIAAGLGAKVALIERHLLGGDCLNVGCVPSKTLIHSARIAAQVRAAADAGVKAGPVEVDFPAVMERMRRVRSEISHHDSAARFRDLGVDVYLGKAIFDSRASLLVGETRLEFKKAIIATGGRAILPPIDGLAAANPHTNESVFSLTTLPPRLAVIGAGPIGCELAQAFLRFGSDVTLIDRGEHVLGREEKDAAEVVQRRFVKEGMRLELNATVGRVDVTNRGKELTVNMAGGVRETLVVDEILVSAGRSPNTSGLGLEQAGVSCQEKRIEIDDRFRTTNPRIFAAGDVAMKWQFTHAADFAARAVVQNALFMGRKRMSKLIVPWSTYADPELAHIGLYPRDAVKAGFEIESWTRPLAEVDRAKTEGDTEGFVRIHTKKGSGRIVGATIVGTNAGELVSEIATAMAAGLELGQIASVIHPYPTRAEGIRQLGDAFNKRKLTPIVAKIFRWWLAKIR